MRHRCSGGGSVRASPHLSQSSQWSLRAVVAGGTALREPRSRLSRGEEPRQLRLAQNVSLHGRQHVPHDRLRRHVQGRIQRIEPEHVAMLSRRTGTVVTHLVDSGPAREGPRRVLRPAARSCQPPVFGYENLGSLLVASETFSDLSI
jgi:hypothetical protein